MPDVDLDFSRHDRTTGVFAELVQALYVKVIAALALYINETRHQDVVHTERGIHITCKVTASSSWSARCTTAPGAPVQWTVSGRRQRPQAAIKREICAARPVATTPTVTPTWLLVLTVL